MCAAFCSPTQPVKLSRDDSAYGRGRRVRLTASGRAPAARTRARLLGGDGARSLGLDLEKDLLAMDRYVGWRLDAEAHLRAVSRQHRDLDLLADHYRLSG